MHDRMWHDCELISLPIKGSQLNNSIKAESIYRSSRQGNAAKQLRVLAFLLSQFLVVSVD